ncbi:MAG: Lrp/AsnC family transcriptional regulator [Acidimicrobiales bacterium]
MDALDRKIVAYLQTDGRMSVTDLADLLPLSISATRDRLRKLEDSGVIDGFTIKINPAAIGRTIEALIDVRIDHRADTVDVESQILSLPSVVDAMHLTGRYDIQLQVAARDVAELDDVLGQLKDLIGAEETNTRLILRTLDGFPRPPRLDDDQ